MNAFSAGFASARWASAFRKLMNSSRTWPGLQKRITFILSAGMFVSTMSHTCWKNLAMLSSRCALEPLRFFPMAVSTLARVVITVPLMKTTCAEPFCIRTAATSARVSSEHASFRRCASRLDHSCLYSLKSCGGSYAISHVWCACSGTSSHCVWFLPLTRRMPFASYSGGDVTRSDSTNVFFCDVAPAPLVLSRTTLRTVFVRMVSPTAMRL
mmetsp:Transcript_31268/g.96616  ORF Transcript_31268/g.96616 Transcript_31268/m.96616 type:complete len:212 (-) Transcript_31268:169-804(-)